MSCNHATNCPLYAQFAMEPALAVWKSHYCESGFSKCARYRLNLNGEAVPLTLLPNGKLVERKEKSKEELGGTALFNAILKKRTSMVKSMLVSHMASVEVISKDGSTPLMAAASVSSPEIINILLDAECNPFKANHIGIKALDVARKKGCDECVCLLSEFMLSNPELKNNVASITSTGKQGDSYENNKDSVMADVVSLLKKLNPFSH